MHARNTALVCADSSVIFNKNTRVGIGKAFVLYERRPRPEGGENNESYIMKYRIESKVVRCKFIDTLYTNPQSYLVEPRFDASITLRLRSSSKVIRSYCFFFFLLLLSFYFHSTGMNDVCVCVCDGRSKANVGGPKHLIELKDETPTY